MSEFTVANLAHNVNNKIKKNCPKFQGGRPPCSQGQTLIKNVTQSIRGPFPIRGPVKSAG